MHALQSCVSRVSDGSLVNAHPCVASVSSNTHIAISAGMCRGRKGFPSLIQDTTQSLQPLQSPRQTCARILSITCSLKRRALAQHSAVVEAASLTQRSECMVHCYWHSGGSATEHVTLLQSMLHCYRARCVATKHAGAPVAEHALAPSSRWRLSSRLTRAVSTRVAEENSIAIATMTNTIINIIIIIII